jgi:hypothetical protein
MKYDGFRFRAEAKLAGKLYGQRFGVDVAFGDPILDAPETVVADDVFGFAGVAPPPSASIRSKRTSRRSYTRTRCRGSDPTRV